MIKPWHIKQSVNASHGTSQRHILPSISAKSFEFITVALTGSLLSLPLMQTAQAATTYNGSVYNGSVSNDALATSEPSVVNANNVSANLFMQCATLKTDAARLACYDKAAIGETTTAGQEKKPLDLVQSFKASIDTGKPKIVLADSPAEASASQEIPASITEATILTKVGVTPAEVRQYTPLSLAYDLDKNSERGILTGRPHNPMYLMPVFTTFKRNRAPQSPTQDVYHYTSKEYEPVELKAQVSVKTKVMEDVFDTNADIWFGYTQQMHWQVYNQDNSRPFRATDYMPEIFMTQPVTANLPYGGKLRMLGAGVMHHSNGQSDPLSRSWNRVYIMGGAEWDKLTLVPKAWIHVKNESEDDPSDNPDITDYYGHGEIQALYDFGKGETLGVTGRYNLGESNGAIQFDYIYPFTSDVHGFLQLFHGYGESIVDYNHKSTAIGVGVTLNDWKGL